jgi:hypothetical protein
MRRAEIMESNIRYDVHLLQGMCLSSARFHSTCSLLQNLYWSKMMLKDTSKFMYSSFMSGETR